MVDNKPNKSHSHTEPHSSQSPQAPDELILNLLPSLNKKQLARVVNGIADLVLTSEILN